MQTAAGGVFNTLTPWSAESPQKHLTTTCACLTTPTTSSGTTAAYMCTLTGIWAHWRVLRAIQCFTFITVSSTMWVRGWKTGCPLHDGPTQRILGGCRGIMQRTTGCGRSTSATQTHWTTKRLARITYMRQVRRMSRAARMVTVPRCPRACSGVIGECARPSVARKAVAPQEFTPCATVRTTTQLHDVMRAPVAVRPPKPILMDHDHPPWVDNLQDRGAHIR